MSDFVENYVDNILAVAEGTEDHESAEGGAYTSAYGITEVARNRYPKEEGESARDYAIRVAGEYAEQAKQELGSEVWEKMPGYMKVVALDVQYNSSIRSNPTFKKNLQAGNFPTALKNTLDIISANDPETGSKGTLPGLAKRRAALYNFAAREMFLPEIKEVVTSAKDDGGVLTEYLTEQGNKVFEQPTSRLHSDGSYGSLTPDEFSYTSPSEGMGEEVQQVSAEPVQAEPQEDSYVVQAGDNLTQISARLGVDMEDLMRANNILDANRIQVGQELFLPVPAAPAQEEQEEEGFFERMYDYGRSQIVRLFD